MSTTIHTLRLRLQDTLRSLGVPFHGVRGDRSKPVGFASILLRYEDTDLELAFGQVAGVPSARLFVLDAQGRRASVGREVSPATLADLLDTVTMPTDEARLRVEAAVHGWTAERTRCGLKISKPSPDGPSAPDVVFVRGGRAYSPAGVLLCGDVRPATLARVWERLAAHLGTTQPPARVELEAADVRRAGIDPGPWAAFRLAAAGPELALWSAMGDGAWALHPATTLWPARLRELWAGRLKLAA